jgi:cytochrome c551
MTFKRVVNVIEVLTLVAAIGFVVALFANEPGGGGGTAKSGPGYDVYVSNCARCHGQEGQGGIGPQLAGQVTNDFPDAMDEIALVRSGRDGMPSFAGDLSPTEIEDVVAYTRTELK